MTRIGWKNTAVVLVLRVDDRHRTLSKIAAKLFTSRHFAKRPRKCLSSVYNHSIYDRKFRNTQLHIMLLYRYIIKNVNLEKIKSNRKTEY